jgi:hypothetical protein
LPFAAAAVERIEHAGWDLWKQEGLSRGGTLMKKTAPKEIVDAYLEAIAARDFALARAWLSDESFSTRSPLSAFESADAYIADVTRVGPILEGIERRKTFVDGNDVCVILDYITRMDQRQVSSVVHWMRVDDGKISYIETLFDARQYAAMFDVE